MKNIIEQRLVAIPQSDGTVVINKQKYRLQIQKFGFWKDVDITEVKAEENQWMITANAFGMSKTDIVPQDTIIKIQNNLGNEVIELGGKEPKKLVKEKTLENIIKRILKEYHI